MLCRRIAAGLAAACVVAAFAHDALAQGRYLEIAARHSRAQALHEAVIVPGADGPQALVTFRIPNSLLFFTQEKNGFEADVEITVELHKEGRKVEERIWRRTHEADSFDQTQSRTDDLEGWVQFDVAPGDYFYRLIVADGSATDRGTTNAFHVPSSKSSVNGSLLFGAVTTDSSMVRVAPANLGGDVPFGENLPAIIPIIHKGDDASFTYQLYRLSPNRAASKPRRLSSRRVSRNDEGPRQPEPIEIGKDDELVASGSVSADHLLPIGALSPGNEDCICWSRQKDSPSNTALAVIDLQTDGLENGTYALDIGSGRGESRMFVFRTLWRELPLSLYDVEVAIRNLEFIEKREAIRSMLKGSRARQVEGFRAYWDKRDPTPNTVRNELMEEYYRRVDHAAVKFRTGQHPVPDGLRTDPARIYILFGEPDRVTHTLPPSGGVEETWSYAEGHTFTFWAASSLMPLELVEK